MAYCMCGQNISFVNGVNVEYNKGFLGGNSYKCSYQERNACVLRCLLVLKRSWHTICAVCISFVHGVNWIERACADKVINDLLPEVYCACTAVSSRSLGWRRRGLSRDLGGGRLGTRRWWRAAPSTGRWCSSGWCCSPASRRQLSPLGSQLPQLKKMAIV